MHRNALIAPLLLVLIASTGLAIVGGAASPSSDASKMSTATSSSPSRSDRPCSDLTACARAALSDDPRRSRAAIGALRDAGPAGLETLLRLQASVLSAGASDPRWPRFTAALDAVAGQRDAYASRLYWYTDLDRARAAARATGKPILSLHLLGRLDEELSCANSRLFRSVLYANHDVASVLRERFVLHWHSVRPVPRVRIDFGDGRVLERTITGNSIHYVLDAEGRPVEAIPGLWGPRAFLAELARAERVIHELESMDPRRRTMALRDYHRQQAEAARSALQVALAEAGIDPAEAQPMLPESTVPADPSRREGSDPSALRASVLTTSKMAMERPMLRELSRSGPADGVDRGDALWTNLAASEIESVGFDAGTISLIASKLSHDAVGDPEPTRLARVIERLQRDVSVDQVRNRLGIQPVIHRWFALGIVGDDVRSLDDRVYAQLFLTPRTDPWLGLAPEDVYMGIANQGIETRVEGAHIR